MILALDLMYEQTLHCVILQCNYIEEMYVIQRLDVTSKLAIIRRTGSAASNYYNC